MAALNIRESGKEMEIGFPSGSVVPLPTANNHANEKISDGTCISESHPPPPIQILCILYCVLCKMCWHMKKTIIWKRLQTVSKLKCQMIYICNIIDWTQTQVDPNLNTTEVMQAFKPQTSNAQNPSFEKDSKEKLFNTLSKWTG